MIEDQMPNRDKKLFACLKNEEKGNNLDMQNLDDKGMVLLSIF